MLDAVTAAVLIAMALALVRALRGPTVFDRIVSVNAFGTLTVVLIAVHGFLAGRPRPARAPDKAGALCRRASVSHRA